MVLSGWVETTKESILRGDRPPSAWVVDSLGIMRDEAPPNQHLAPGAMIDFERVWRNLFPVKVSAHLRLTRSLDSRVHGLKTVKYC